MSQLDMNETKTAQRAQPKTEAKTDAVPPAEKQVDRPVIAMSESCVQFADHDEPRFLVKVPDTIPYEDLFVPLTWKNVRAKYAPVGKSLAGSQLICKDNKGTYRAVLEVRLDGQWGMRVEEIHLHTYKVPAVPPENADDYEVKFLSANRGWGVVRRSDNLVIATAGDEMGARLKRDQHVRLMAA